MSSVSGFRSRQVLARIVIGLGMGSALPYGCSSDDEQSQGLASRCTLNSDCTTPLVCVFQRCHAACKTSVDCTGGAQCLVSAAGGVCELSGEASDGGKLPGTGGGTGTGGASSGGANTGGNAETGGTAGTGGEMGTGGGAGLAIDAGRDSTTPGPDGGTPGCDTTWLSSPPNWFGAAGGTDWRPELHDPRWASAPLEQFAVAPAGVDSVGGLFRTLMKGRTLYVLFESTKQSPLTFADVVYFGVTRGTGGLGAYAVRMTPDSTTLPVKAPGAGVPRDPTLPVKTDAAYVDWYDTVNTSATPPVWNVHAGEIPPWLSDVATWRGSPGVAWAMTFKVDLTAIGAAGDLRAFHGMTIDPGSPASPLTFADPVLPATASSVNGETIIPSTSGDVCDDADPDTLLNNPCWRNLPAGGITSGISVAPADIGVLDSGSVTDRFRSCGAGGAPCPTNGSSIANTVRITVHGVPSFGVTAHAVRAQIRIADASTPGDPNAPWKLLSPLAPDGVFIAEQRTLTSDASWDWSYDAASGDATIDYTCTASANDYCPKLTNLADRNQCLLVELAGAPAVGAAFSSFVRSSAFRDVVF